MSSQFSKTVSSRILILDGAMGSMIQRASVPASDFMGEHNNDSLSLTRPDVIAGIHRQYIEAGADIISTDSFGANRMVQETYGLGDRAAEMAEAAARIARTAADGAARKVWVAGSVGPTGKSLSLASDASDPGFRQSSFREMKEACKEQISALLRGGADLILLETWFDALNAKAAIKALEELGADIPLIISATVSDRSGRTLTGQTPEAFYHSVKHAPGLVAFGVNCALGAAQMAPIVSEISAFCDLPLIFYPNAGIPDELGRYNDSPEEMATVMGALASKGQINIAGGCCGTTPDHIRAIAAAVSGKTPRVPANAHTGLWVSGLEAVPIDPSRNFTNIGERTNVAGSRKFARLISEGSYDEALRIAAAQIDGGAGIIDINMDDPMLDSAKEMCTFLRHISNDPAVARAAIMIDSSHWGTIEEGLENVQGRAIVNSISLKDGEEEFLRRARHIADMGAAMVVMAFDEEGQATTFERKTSICERSYRLLTGAGISPRDIIFDVNVLSIGTGIAEHARFGVDFIEAVRWIKANLPGALTSGGISNLSFAFRGNNRVREAMHSAFLYHAVRAGLDMAIVNPQMLQIYDGIDPELLKGVEDVIFDRSPEATTRLVAIAGRFAAEAETGKDTVQQEPVSEDVGKRLCNALVKGGSKTLEADVLECLKEKGNAVDVIEGPLMKGMETVGGLFADGKMFLPQVVKSAKVMRDAVAVLEPYMQAGGSAGSRPRAVIATVKGDVHDIGKNITSIVLQCGGFEVFDLGVMVPCEEILAKAVETGADIIGVSGLITPSLSRMEELCREMASRGMDIPLFVGGAAASAVHTAVKLAPIYGNVHYGPDASATAVMAKRCISSPGEFRENERKEHARLRELYSRGSTSGQAEGFNPEGGYAGAGAFDNIPLCGVPTADVAAHLDWRMFYAVCGVKDEAEELKREAMELLDKGDITVYAEVEFFDCRKEGDDIVSADGSLRLPMLRQESGRKASLADFFPEDGFSPLGLFAVRVSAPGNGCSCCVDLVEHSLRVCLAEAASSLLHEKLSAAAGIGIKVIMPGIGYACCPDHSLKRDVLERLSIGIELTESCSMIPEASICGLVMAHRDAFFPDIRKISGEAIDRYSGRRGFSEGEKALFLGHLKA